jgi:hypothetical protein
VVVSYKGIHCFGETDADGILTDSDEPYAILSYSSPERANTIRSKIYEDVDAGETRQDFIELYRGKPYGIALNVVVIEHGEGNPDKYRDEVRTVVMTAHKAGVVALRAIPFVGPVLALAAEGFLTGFMPQVADKIVEHFGDRLLRTSNTVLSAKQMVLLAAKAPVNNFDGVVFKVESQLLSGYGASYKVYFDVYSA